MLSLGQSKMFRCVERVFRFFGAAAMATCLLVGGHSAWAAETSEFSDQPIPMKTPDELPARTPPLVEVGPDFLGPGNIPEGIELPTGAVWTPALWVFGSYRTALQYFDRGPTDQLEEWRNRLDLFANVHMTPTERLLVGISPLRDGSDFSGCDLSSGGSECEWHTDLDVTTVFVEGEFGEIFPNLDPDDSRALDVGFSVGRQLLFFQEGMMLNDTVDGVGVTRDNIILPGIVDLRITGFFGWDNIDREPSLDGGATTLLGLFTETDFRKSTFNLDATWVIGSSNENAIGDTFNIGASSVQRVGLYNTAFRVNHSVAFNPAGQKTTDGTLFFAESSTTPAYSHDVAYLNAFLGLDSFTSAARDPIAGGPLARVGILFAGVGLGNYGSALSNDPDDSYGAALGYQKFFNQQRTQLVLELGGRGHIDGVNPAAGALGLRLQHALGDRTLLQIDGFASVNEDQADGQGLRAELLFRF